MDITKDIVLNALRDVHDPDLRKDLVSLGMIEDVKIAGNKVMFSIVLTTPACPMKNLMKKDAIDAIHKHISADIEVEVELTSRVTSGRKKTSEVLSGIKNIIAVASGKGGVGKSTIAANLAVSLAKTGARTGLLDADIYGPSVPIMFGLQGQVPKGTEVDGKTKVIPIEKYGVKLMSIGFFVDPQQALVWRGPMASSALNQLVGDVVWDELDYLVIDMPPGTGDIHLTLVQSVPVTGVVVVTTPQQVALADARKAISMFTQENINVPVLGLVENMAYFTPAELPGNKYYIFGKEGGLKLCKELNLTLLGQIPIVESVCDSGDKGKPAVAGEDGPVSEAFTELAGNVAQQVAIRNATAPPTKIVEIK